MDLDNSGADALPVRTRRTRPGGRHRNPDTILLPPDPPALLLGVSGAAPEARADLAASVVNETAVHADATEQGLAIRRGYLDGGTGSLASLLDGLRATPDAGRMDAVLVPLLAGPHPTYQARLRRAAETASVAVAVAGPLGPHPLLAGILHHRLAESGLARPDRVRMLSVTTAADGVIVAVPGGAEAAQAAEATAVLLASRLAVPVVPAALDVDGAVENAAGRLRTSGASRLALAPCLIGPEADPDQVEQAAGAVDARACAPVGAHPDVAKLVMQSYVSALDEAMADAPEAPSPAPDAGH